MGRRKIEIQPITHERNRSVTFLKRRNGLFKKAYELGVLCSVDIAVIIFEERPGHTHKLFQYGSSNVQDIIQRRLRYDGEMDSRGPGDFTGNAASADVEEPDDEDPDEEQDDLLLPSSIRGGTKRKNDGKLKSMPSRLNPSLDYLPRSQHHSPPLGITIPHQTHGPTSSIPTSSDRLQHSHESQYSHDSHKKARLGGPSPHSPFPPSTTHMSPRGSNFERGGGGDGGSHGYRSIGGAGPSSHQHQQPYTPRPLSSSSAYPQYPAFFPPSHGHGHGHSNPSPPPPSFIPLQQDYQLSGSSSRSRGRSTSHSTAGNGFVHRGPGAGYESVYDARGGGGGGGGEVYGIDAGRSRGGGDARGFGMDWPVHTSTSQAPPGAAPPRLISAAGPEMTATQSMSIAGGGAELVRSGSGGGSSVGQGEPAQPTDWLDFLSGTGKGVTPAGSGRPPSSGSGSGQKG